MHYPTSTTNSSYDRNPAMWQQVVQLGYSKEDTVQQYGAKSTTPFVVVLPFGQVVSST
jgi:hypothetical protein